MANRRIGGAGGGSDEGNRGAGPIVALSVAVVIGAGGVSATVTAANNPGTSSGSSSRSRVQIRVDASDSASAQARLVRRGLRVTAKVTSDATDCAGHAYGQVRDFLRRQPCVALHRALFEVRDPKGDVVLLAVSWAQMPDSSSARALKSLVDTDGTGNITELSREEGRYRSVRYTGAAYTSRLDGTVVVNAQAQPVLRGAAGLALTSLVTNAVG